MEILPRGETKDKYKNPETVCVMVRIHVKHESVCHVQFNFGEAGSRVNCQKSSRHSMTERSQQHTAAAQINRVSVHEYRGRQTIV